MDSPGGREAGTSLKLLDGLLAALVHDDPLCAQIPAPRQHLVRYYGWYSHRARVVRGGGAAIETSSSPSTPRSRSWARLLREIFEVEPLLCPQCPISCSVEMQLVSVIQTPTVIDGILGHLQRIGGKGSTSDLWSVGSREVGARSFAGFAVSSEEACELLTSYLREVRAN